MSTLTELKTNNLDSHIASQNLSVVYFWASWCKSCKALSPVVEELSREFSGRANFVKVNSDEQPDVTVKYNLVGYPTILFFKGGELAEKLEGNISKFKLKERIGELV